MKQPISQSSKLRSDLSQFIGTESWHAHHFINEMTYTDGVKCFADITGSFWFIDFIATNLFI